LTRADAPHGVDQFHRLAKIGFFTNAAFYRYAPNLLVEWGVSANSSLNAEFGHTPIPDDPPSRSNLRGTVSFADNGMGRATVVFINFKNNSHLDSHLVPFATVAESGSMATAEAIHDPTPNSTAGVSPKAYADNGNAWIRKTYPGINFITGVTLSD
jgi:peptidyl-prolyl cis-trans isomerase A (cyclophilin A)